MATPVQFNKKFDSIINNNCGIEIEPNINTSLDLITIY